MVVLAQKHNALYAEALGAGLTGTINYDFRFKEDITGDFKDALGLRAGIGLSPKYIYDASVALHPVSTGGVKPLLLLGINTFQDLSYSKSAGDDLEFGANLLYAPANSIADKWGKFKQTDRIIPSINIGYRKQDDITTGLVVRVCYNPYFLDGKLHQWFGVSVGYHFN